MTESKKILIVEDETSIAEVLVDKLTNEGFTISWAKNGLDGLAMAESLKPDLILLDVIMPKMDGLTMLKKLRQDAWGQRAQVIILSNLSDGDEVSEAMKSEVFDYLVKSDWKLEDVIKKIREKLK